MTGSIPCEASVTALTATVDAYRAEFGDLPARYATIAQAAAYVGSGGPVDTNTFNRLAVLRSRAAELDDGELFYRMTGGDWTPTTPAATAAVDGVGSTRTLEQDLSELDTRLFDRLLGLSQGVVDRVIDRLGLKLAAKAAAKVAPKQGHGSEWLERAVVDGRLVWSKTPMSARAALSFEQEALIAGLVGDELGAVDALLADGQMSVVRVVAEGAGVDAAVVEGLVTDEHGADRARAVDMFKGLMATLLLNRFTSDDSATPLDAPAAAGIIWDVISVAGGADVTPAGGLGVGQDRSILVDGVSGRGRYLGQSEKTLRMIEDLGEAKTGQRAGVVHEYTFRHSGSPADSRNEIHRRMDGVTWRDGEYEEKMFDAVSQTFVAPGQYPGCGCRIESKIVEDGQPGPRILGTVEQAAELLGGA